MATHPADKGHDNPRVQCSVCGKWTREYTLKGSERYGIPKGERTQTFYGACDFAPNTGDHLAGDHVDVCDDCCHVECKRLAETRALQSEPDTGGASS